MAAEGFLYRRLASEIQDKIGRGDLRPGERLPSLRGLHRKLGLSLSTIYQAYAELEALDLVEARPKSGFYVKETRLMDLPAPRHVRQLSRPNKVKLSAITNAVVAASLDPGLVPLGASTLSPDLLPYKHLGRIMKSISPEKMKTLLQYAPSEGDPELRRQLARRLLGLLPGIGPEGIVITNGCIEAVSLALLSLTSPGDVVAVESPTHFGFLQLLKGLGLYVVEVPTDPRLGLDLAALEMVLDQNQVKACLSMPNFHNPLGALMPEDHKKGLVDLLNQRRVPLIEDDIYAELHYSSKRPSLLQSYDKKGLVITCSSVSKVMAPGFRVGWLAAGERIAERLGRLKAGVSMTSPTMQQYILARFLASGSYDRYLDDLRAKVQKQVVLTALAVREHFPVRCRLAAPQGGNMLWIELPEWADGMELYRLALEKGISTIPGAAFTTTDKFRNFIRLSCTTMFSAKVERALADLGGLIRGLKP